MVRAGRRGADRSRNVPRRPRHTCWTDAACYHVMNRGQNRATIFADDGDRQHFLNLLARYGPALRFGSITIVSWTTTFICSCNWAQPRQLSRLMASLLVAYARYFQKRYGRYIERNPVAAQLVEDAWQYPGQVAGHTHWASAMRCWRSIPGMSNGRRSRSAVS